MICAALISLVTVTSALAAPTVHLVKQEDNQYIPDNQYVPTDYPPIVDPVWMTVTMKPLTKTTVVQPVNKVYQPSIPVPNHHQQPQQPSNQPSYQPYYYQTPIWNHHQLAYPYNNLPQQLYPSHSVQWPPVMPSAQHVPVLSQYHPVSSAAGSLNVQPCGHRNGPAGVGYQQYGY